MRFEVLGPVRVWREERELDPGFPQQRALLALLLAHAGRPVPTSEILDVLWAERPPASALNVVRRYVGALRRLLEPGLPPRAPGRRLLRRPGGYLLEAATEEVDLLRFRELTRQGKRAAATGRAETATRHFVLALGEWRGPVAMGIPASAREHVQFTAVQRELLDTVRPAADAALLCGRAEQVLPALRRATAHDLLDESLHARLVLVLAACGLQAEALGAYEDVRRRLLRDLGITPGAELAAAHTRVLRQEVGRRLRRGPELQLGQAIETVRVSTVPVDPTRRPPPAAPDPQSATPGGPGVLPSTSGAADRVSGPPVAVGASPSASAAAGTLPALSEAGGVPPVGVTVAGAEPVGPRAAGPEAAGRGGAAPGPAPGSVGAEPAASRSDDGASAAPGTAVLGDTDSGPGSLSLTTPGAADRGSIVATSGGSGDDPGLAVSGAVDSGSHSDFRSGSDFPFDHTDRGAGASGPVGSGRAHPGPPSADPGGFDGLGTATGTAGSVRTVGAAVTAPGEPVGDGDAGVSAFVRPAQLPSALPAFVGRVGELAWLEAAAGSAAGVVLVGGPAGIGKSTLALHWAHRIADRFPDGQLYVALRGYDPAGPAVGAADALRGMLSALGVPASRMPDGVDALSGAYRTLLASRRVLVVLDDAADAARLGPLLPAGPGCLALVTSRHALPGLVASGARSLRLAPPSAEDAHALLAGRIGAGRAAAEPGAVDEIAARCGRLPLALATVAARVVSRRDFPLAAVAAGLREAHGSLDALPATREAFMASYRALAPDSARLFRLLPRHEGPDITPAGAAVLAGLPVRRARQLLGVLADAHLLTEPAPGHYALHELLRVFATERAAAEGCRNIP